MTVGLSWLIIIKHFPHLFCSINYYHVQILVFSVIVSLSSFHPKAVGRDLVVAAQKVCSAFASLEMALANGVDVARLLRTKTNLA
jgi:hypothetical protein